MFLPFFTPFLLGLHHLRRLILMGGLLGVTLFFNQCAPYLPARSGEKIYRNLAFSSPQPGVTLKMDLYVPQTATPAPVVLWIFGGSWKFGWKDFHVVLRNLTDSGLALACIQYRVSGVAKWPAQMEDCQAAAQWLRDHGAQYGIDPARMGASGESAGGHLAALLGTTENDPKIKAVCALYPPTDMVDLGREYYKPERESAIDRLFGGPIETKLAMARDASPINHVSKNSPPFFLIHGVNDKLVNPKHSIGFKAKLNAAGIEAHLMMVPDKGHWFSLTDAQLAEVAAFFKKHLKPEPGRS